MAKILMAWELGGGLGHLANLLPLAHALRERGDTLEIAVRDLSVLPDDLRRGTRIWQAPAKSSRFKRAIATPRTYGEIAHNCGFGDSFELQATASAWLNLYSVIRPDLVLCEHSPTALLAARQSGVPAIMIGTGFCCPTPDAPLRDLRNWAKSDATRSARTEQLLMDNCNAVLTNDKRLAYVGQLFDVPSLVMTVPELDPYGVRPLATYFGAWSLPGGLEPIWPAGNGPRLFAYLKPFPTLPMLLALLNELRLPSLIVADGIDRQLQKRASSPSLKFVEQPLDMNLVLSQCDIGICNSNHGTTVGLLRAGKPGFYLPLHLEQTLTAHVVHRLGAGLMASIHRPEQVALRLMEMLRNPQFADSARQVASRWRRWHAPERLPAMVKIVDHCL